jgi:hypothetical protein
MEANETLICLMYPNDKNRKLEPVLVLRRDVPISQEVLCTADSSLDYSAIQLVSMIPITIEWLHGGTNVAHANESL